MITTIDGTIQFTIALIIIFVSGYLLGTVDEIGRENRRREKRRNKHEKNFNQTKH